MNSPSTMDPMHGREDVEPYPQQQVVADSVKYNSLPPDTGINRSVRDGSSKSTKSLSSNSDGMDSPHFQVQPRTPFPLASPRRSGICVLFPSPNQYEPSPPPQDPRSPAFVVPIREQPTCCIAQPKGLAPEYSLSPSFAVFETLF